MVGVCDAAIPWDCFASLAMTRRGNSRALEHTPGLLALTSSRLLDYHFMTERTNQAARPGCLGEADGARVPIAFAGNLNGRAALRRRSRAADRPSRQRREEVG